MFRSWLCYIAKPSQRRTENLSSEDQVLDPNRRAASFGTENAEGISAEHQRIKVDFSLTCENR